MNVIPWDGKPITQPGIYSGIPMHDTLDAEGNRRPGYHSWDICDGGSLSSSVLRATEQKSMDEVWLTFPGNPDREEQEDKVHLNRGRARHTLFLGESGFAAEFVIQPATYPAGATYPSLDGTEDKKWTAAALWCKAWTKAQTKAGKLILPTNEMDDIKGAAAKLNAHPEIRDCGILNGLVEHSIFWKDPVTGLWLKSRPDVIPTDSTMVVDYKGAAEVSYQKIERAMGEFGYGQQLALVAEGLREVTGIEVTDHVLVFQKWTAPWSVNVKPIMGYAIQFGAMQNRRAINRIAEALQTGIWPGPADDGVPVGLPKYVEQRLKKEEEAGLLPQPTRPS